MARFQTTIGSLLLLAWIAMPGFAQSTVPDGAQFQVNTYTTSTQDGVAVAVDGAGFATVFWHSFGADNGGPSDSWSVQGQRYAPDGAPLGDQFLVSPLPSISQKRPAVATNEAGDLVVVWDSYFNDFGDFSDKSIQSHRYDSNGAPLGSQFQANTHINRAQINPDVALDQDGNFVVVWQSGGFDELGSGELGAPDTSIQGQRFASDGMPLGEQFLVNTYTTNDQEKPKLAMSPQGDFVVVWESDGSDNGDTSSFSLQGQLFAPNGVPIGDQFLVNTYTTDDQKRPAVAMAPSGDFVVVWQSFGSDNGDTSYWSIQGQRFASNGTKAGSQFLVNTYTTYWQSSAAISMDADGDFIVVWRSEESDDADTSDSSIQAQRFASNGNRIGEQFLVNTYTTSFQRGPALATHANGDFVVLWDSEGADNDSSFKSIQGQRFHVFDPFFADGFETGDTSAWSPNR